MDTLLSWTLGIMVCVGWIRYLSQPETGNEGTVFNYPQPRQPHVSWQGSTTDSINNAKCLPSLAIPAVHSLTHIDAQPQRQESQHPLPHAS